jgi:hypothetical protein
MPPKTNHPRRHPEFHDFLEVFHDFLEFVAGSAGSRECHISGRRTLRRIGVLCDPN